MLISYSGMSKESVSVNVSNEHGGGSSQDTSRGVPDQGSVEREAQEGLIEVSLEDSGSGMANSNTAPVRRSCCDSIEPDDHTIDCGRPSYVSRISWKASKLRQQEDKRILDLFAARIPNPRLASNREKAELMRAIFDQMTPEVMTDEYAKYLADEFIESGKHAVDDGHMLEGALLAYVREQGTRTHHAARFARTVSMYFDVRLNGGPDIQKDFVEGRQKMTEGLKDNVDLGYRWTLRFKGWIRTLVTNYEYALWFGSAVLMALTPWMYGIGILSGLVFYRILMVAKSARDGVAMMRNLIYCLLALVGLFVLIGLYKVSQRRKAANFVNEGKLGRAYKDRQKRKKEAPEEKEALAFGFNGITIASLAALMFSSVGLLVLPFMGFIDAGKYAAAGKHLSHSTKDASTLLDSIGSLFKGFFSREREGRVCDVHFIMPNGSMGRVIHYSSSPISCNKKWAKVALVTDPATGEKIWHCVNVWPAGQHEVWCHQMALGALLQGSIKKSDPLDMVRLFWNEEKQEPCMKPVAMPSDQSPDVWPEEELWGGISTTTVKSLLKQLVDEKEQLAADQAAAEEIRNTPLKQRGHKAAECYDPSCKVCNIFEKKQRDDHFANLVRKVLNEKPDDKPNGDSKDKEKIDPVVRQTTTKFGDMDVSVDFKEESSDERYSEGELDAFENELDYYFSGLEQDRMDGDLSPIVRDSDDEINALEDMGYTQEEVDEFRTLRDQQRSHMDDVDEDIISDQLQVPHYQNEAKTDMRKRWNKSKRKAADAMAGIQDQMVQLGVAFRQRMCGAKNYFWEGIPGKIRFAILIGILIAACTAILIIVKLIRKKKPNYKQEADFTLKYDDGTDVPPSVIAGGLLQVRPTPESEIKTYNIYNNMNALLKNYTWTAGKHLGTLTKKDGHDIKVIPITLDVARDIEGKPRFTREFNFRKNYEQVGRYIRDRTARHWYNARPETVKDICVHAEDCPIELLKKVSSVKPCTANCHGEHCHHTNECVALMCKLDVPVMGDNIPLQESMVEQSAPEDDRFYIEPKQREGEVEKAPKWVAEAWVATDQAQRYDRSLRVKDADGRVRNLVTAKRYKNAIHIPAHAVDMVEKKGFKSMDFWSPGGGSMTILRPEGGWWSAWYRLHNMVDTAALPLPREGESWPMMPNPVCPQPGSSFRGIVFMRNPDTGRVMSSHADVTADKDGYLLYKFSGHMAGHCGSTVAYDNQTFTSIGGHIQGDEHSDMCKGAAYTPKGIAELEEISSRSALSRPGLN